MLSNKEIVDHLPYSKPFLFVDRILNINEKGVEGEFTFRKEQYFYQGHFKDHPITPGVILTECMAQIGVVSLGIFLLQNELKKNIEIAMSSTNIDFFLPVLPGTKVIVKSHKIFYRFQKLKCKIMMYNKSGKLVCRGEIAGMIKSSK